MIGTNFSEIVLNLVADYDEEKDALPLGKWPLVESAENALREANQALTGNENYMQFLLKYARVFSAAKDLCTAFLEASEVKCARIKALADCSRMSVDILERALDELPAQRPGALFPVPTLDDEIVEMTVFFPED